MKRVLTSLLLLTAFFAACLFFYFCLHNDNKYTAPGAQPVSGVLILENDEPLAMPAAREMPITGEKCVCMVASPELVLH